MAILVGLLICRLPNAVDNEFDIVQSSMVQIAHVIDGDTVELKDGRRVRLLGVDSPELGYNDDPEENGATESLEWLRHRIEGADVKLRYGPERLDRYGRTLAWIYLQNGALINKELLETGHARLVTGFGLPADLSAELHQAAARARVRNRGIWSDR
ncbi:MAG: thermonuclease family protein [Fuerstiella sp.]|nr:thermonuclease family protein [Fuerstiella sp.]